MLDLQILEHKLYIYELYTHEFYIYCFLYNSMNHTFNTHHSVPAVRFSLSL